MTCGNEPIVLALPGNEVLAADLVSALGAEPGRLTLHRFPDQEICVRVVTPVAGRDVVLVCALDRPNDKLVKLYLAASTLRSLGARRVLLVAPYLPYMRQDSSFHAGEGVSALYIGRWLSDFLDGLVTVDPHLHRTRNLHEIYRMPAIIVHSAAAIARWIRDNVSRPMMLVGPDAESRQWIERVAREVPCDYLVLDKVRLGDHDVELRPPTSPLKQDRAAVLVDDIISTGGTMLAAIRRLRADGFDAPICIGVHALFIDDAYRCLRRSGAQNIVTCNTIPHASNAIDLHRWLAPAVRELLAQPPQPGR
ncbi:MAG: ribose-phosphate diphosphokinase [Gammaproteobacteria bacterium]|nr:ribose-phosphate diphosphokinase [Gammaproteobacteria bacterium]